MILSKEDYLSRIKNKIGDDNSDEAIAFIEDMTDTYNDMEAKVNSDSEDWKSKYDELDKSWREKYRARFFDTPSTNPTEIKKDQKEDIIKDGDETTFEDLFTDKE